MLSTVPKNDNTIPIHRALKHVSAVFELSLKHVSAVFELSLKHVSAVFDIWSVKILFIRQTENR